MGGGSAQANASRPETLSGDENEAKRDLHAEAWASQTVRHENRRAERYRALTVADEARGNAGRAVSAHVQLVELVGQTRLGNGRECLLRIWGDPRRPMERIDFDSACDRGTTADGGPAKAPSNLSITQIACGIDHMLWLQAGAAWGVGNTWNGQIVRRWEPKPAKCLIAFRTPVQIDLEGPPEAKEDSKDEGKGQVENSQPGESSAHKGDAADVKHVRRKQEVGHIPAQATAVAAARHGTCVAYENEIRWTVFRKLTAPLYRQVSAPRAVIQVALRQGASAAAGGLVLTSAGQAFALDKSESEDSAAHLDLVAENVSLVGATADKTFYVQGTTVVPTEGASRYDVGEDVLEFACGLQHCLVLTRDQRRVFAWGSNELGALGLSRSTCLQGGAYETPQLVNGRLGPFWEKCERVEHICAGENYSALLLEEGRVYTWGEMAPGSLRLRPQIIDVPDYLRVRSLWAGGQYLVLQCTAKEQALSVNGKS